MRTEFEEYMETGMVGAYQPGRAFLRQEEEGVFTSYRDTVYHFTEKELTGNRMMTVGDRCFRITSVFPADASATATDKFLSYIDSELEKEAHSA
ncbi:MAG: hypothetical protein IJB67_00615 [Firmicutes bacterium]|nr:hypothetical protein [Bacillota bacterium]